MKSKGDIYARAGAPISLYRERPGYAGPPVRRRAGGHGMRVLAIVIGAAALTGLLLWQLGR